MCIGVWSEGLRLFQGFGRNLLHFFKSNESSHRKASTLRRDLHATSPQNIHTLLSKQVIRILKFIRYELFF